MKENEIKIGKDYFGLISFYTIKYHNEKSYNNLFNNFFQYEPDRKIGKLDIPSGLLANLTFVEKKEGYIFVKSKLSANIYTLALLIPSILVIILLITFIGLKLNSIFILFLILVYNFGIFNKIIYEEHSKIKNQIISKLYEIQ
ncbi:hypothetical protein [Epilithonimonas sp.]|uniref:hypothetical protein n=1 Tax=Epilithonimonas sp. TaxID=2894511 RepID=UPI0035AE6E20